jgi:hypothetical protein
MSTSTEAEADAVCAMRLWERRFSGHGRTPVSRDAQSVREGALEPHAGSPTWKTSPMTSVQQIFDAAGIIEAGVVPWGQAVPVVTPGIYVISTSQDPLSSTGLAEAPLMLDAQQALLAARPELTIDGAPAGPRELAARLQLMWPEGEPIAYIGQTGKALSARVKAFYDHRLGARTPHGGGWPIKLLDPDQLWAHYAATPDPQTAELDMLDAFTAGLPADVRAALIDSALALPYANLERKKGQRKQHGIRGAKETRRRRTL